MAFGDPTLDNTLGALLVGCIISSITYGISSLYVYIYYHTYVSDRNLLKFSVGVIWLLDTLHTVLLVMAVYRYTIRCLGLQECLFEVHWTIKAITMVNIFLVLLVQSIYVQRVWRISGHYHSAFGYIPFLILLGGFAVGIVLVQRILFAKSFLELNNPTIRNTSKASFAIATAIDFAIAFSMCYYLNMSKIRGISGSQLNSRISLIMQYTICSGLLISVVSMAALMSTIFMPRNFIFLSLTFFLNKVYVVSYLAMLNSRRTNNESTAAASSIAISTSSRVYRDRDLTAIQPLPHSFLEMRKQNQSYPERGSGGLDDPQKPAYATAW
ncbi:hypothetical protein C8J57DRAFT_1276702 [Mycena rebaudengoi]|nr:hypothetical protein C8J57DRAFT_1276702 [Mycena rebaudengoi]